MFESLERGARIVASVFLGRGKAAAEWNMITDILQISVLPVRSKDSVESLQLNTMDQPSFRVQICVGGFHRIPIPPAPRPLQIPLEVNSLCSDA